MNVYRCRLLPAILIISSLMLGLTPSFGQQTTEQFIPIGKSPGISNSFSYIGSIVSVDEETRTIVVESNRGSKTIRVTPTTRLWLDRSRMRLTTMEANYSDCKVGRKVEVMYDHEDHSVAVWIKIESS